MLSTKHLCAASLQPISLKSLEGEISTEQQCLQLLRKQYSLSEIYRLTGKSRCYLRRLALLNDIPLKLKPKKLTGECQKGSLGWPTPGCTERRYRSGAVSVLAQWSRLFPASRDLSNTVSGVIGSQASALSA